MNIPQDKIDEIRVRANIVEIISEYLPLKKNGKNHIGLCPFHSEKTPSFTVNDEKQIFYCFGCGTGGNAFIFLMKQENLSFPDAVRNVAKRVGIDLAPIHNKPSGEEYQSALMYTANQTAQDFYHNYLLKAPDADNARLYIKKRGLKPEIVENFKIGFAPAGSNSLVRFLAGKGISLEIAEKAGLVIKSDNKARAENQEKTRGISPNDFYDRFRNKIMFPITDIRARVIGFGGRTLGNEEPKYLNSPSSPLFKKGEVVYGMYHAKNYTSNKGFVIIVEGYFDLLMMHQYGFINTVATLGTALTIEHLRRLRGYAKEFYTLFDSDNAGKAAALKSIPMFIDEDIHAKVVLIPAGMDPDDLLRKHGAQSLSQYIQNAKSVMDYFLDSVRTRFDIETPNGKVSFLETTAPYVANIKNTVERDIYVEKIANIIHLRPEAVLAAIKSALEIINSKPKLGGKTVPTTNEIITSGSSSKIEETILKILLTHPKLYDKSVKDAIEMFKIDFLKEAGKSITDVLENGKAADKNKIDMSSIVDSSISDRARTWLLKTSAEDDESIKEDTEKILEDCCKKILMASNKKETSALLNKMEDAEKKGDTNSEHYRSAATSYLTMKRDIPENALDKKK